MPTEPFQPFEMRGGPNELTATERCDFAWLDGEVKRLARDRGLALGRLLREVRDRRLYRSDFPSWPSYCEARLEFGKRQADRLIAFAGLMDEWDPGVPAPVSERQARLLVPLERDVRRVVALRIGDFEAVSAGQVAAVVREVLSEQDGSLSPPSDLVLVKGGPVTLEESRVLRYVARMHAAALAIAHLGPHAIPDAVAALSAEQAERVRVQVEGVGNIAARLLGQVERVHGASPAGQQRWLLIERPSKR